MLYLLHFSAIFYDKYSESYWVLEEAAPPAPLANSLREFEKMAKIVFCHINKKSKGLNITEQ